MRRMSAPLSMKENVCKISVFEINIKLSVLFFVVECCLIQRNTQFKRKYFGMEQFNDKCISTGWRFSHLFFRFHFLQHFCFFRRGLANNFDIITLTFSFFNFVHRDEHEPLNTMDCDSMKKPLSVEYDGRTVHSRSGDFLGKNSAV